MPVPVYCNRQSSINSTLKYALSRESALSPGSAYSCESRDSYSLLNLQPRDGIVDSEFKYEVEGTCSGTVPNWQDGGFCHGSRGRLPTRNSYEISKQNRDTISPIFSSIREVASPRGDSSSFMHLIGIDGITKFDAENDNIRVWEFLGDFDTEMLFSRNAYDERKNSLGNNTAMLSVPYAYSSGSCCKCDQPHSHSFGKVDFYTHSFNSPFVKRADILRSPLYDLQLFSVRSKISISLCNIATDTVADWVANYIWVYCANGIESNILAVKSQTPSDSLRLSIHGLLVSTLLQPSVIILALYYITRLPLIFCRLSHLTCRQASETELELELLGIRDVKQISPELFMSVAPFKLVVLGCILANKWLDDHTFSNITWHSISNIPLENINRLEYLGLVLLNHDLNISLPTWNNWVYYLRNYHCKGAFDSVLDESSSAKLVNFILEMLEGLIMLPPYIPLHDCAEPGKICGLCQPILPGYELLLPDGLSMKVWREDSDFMDINLDEDGPLREEYIPRRYRTQGAIY